MSSISVRRVISACIVAAAFIAALVAPGAANASLLTHCGGASTTGAGSSFQLELQNIWDPGFNTNKVGCTAVGAPKITYSSIGSGAGYKEWNEKEHFGTVGFVGTDNTVNAAEKSSIEAKQEGTGGTVLTIPVAQGAVTIPVNLPTGCTATSTIAPGRLAMNNATLEGIFAGTVTKWNQIEAQEGTGNALSGAECNKETPISVIVRLDGSGTTHIFKRYLNLIDTASLASEDGKSHTWGELAEGSLSTTWPTATKVIKPKESTNVGLLKEITATPGSIGYANLGDARNPANGGFTGQSPQRFWTMLENSSKTKSGKTKRKYADPSTNGDVAELAASNCKKTVFSNGGNAFPPPAVSAPWNEVTTQLTSKTYSLCGLTYDLVLKNYEAYKGGTAAEATTVVDFEKYLLSKKGGQKELAGKDYSPLPKELVSESLEGIATIEG
jgi:ABC-type phosphate transport system substrate-binding protein